MMAINVFQEADIMFKLDKSKRIYPLLTALFGFCVFLFSGISVNFIFIVINRLSHGTPNSTFEVPFLGLLIIGAAGGFLLGLLLGMKGKLVKVTLSSIAGVFLGTMLGFMFGEAFASIAPSFTETEIPNMVLFFFMNAAYCATIAAVYCGFKSIWFFALTGALCSVPISLMMYVTKGIILHGFDLNFLLIVASVGITSGFCIGLYELLKPKSE